MKYNITFSQIIIKAREKKGMSQKNLAKKLKISQSYLCKMERDKQDYPPSPEILAKLSEELEIDEKTILNLSGRVSSKDLANFKFLMKHYPDMSQLIYLLKKDYTFAERIFDIFYAEVARREEIVTHFLRLTENFEDNIP